MGSKLVVQWGLLALLATACGGSPRDAAGTGAAGGAAGSAVGVLSGGAGSSGTSSGGSAGQMAVDVGPQQQSNKLDVLFVVDDSAHMADKQAVLAASLPAFVNRLAGAVGDIHFGVITTGLGDHGGYICSLTNAQPGSYPDDQAQLLPSKRDGVASYMNSGYLAFDESGQAGVADATAVSAELSSMIRAAGETGCGYEAPLEAMYRFLVDPEPPLSVVKGQDGNSSPMGLNTALLAQRGAFLRPDSSVAIVVLSDENDCSILDQGVGWLVGYNQNMPRATVACEANPNDACCRSCAESERTPPAGCMALSADANCANITSSSVSYATWDSAHDSLNLRCFDQARRFGFDLLNPIERYTTGLTNPKVPNRAGVLVDNPLLAARGGLGPRSASLISVSVIVGAPWQDLATDASLSAGAPLQLLSAAELVSKGRWPVLVGDAKANVKPLDPLMIEAIEPRSGTNPVVPIAIAPATSMNPLENAINGHEHVAALQDDLQYACIFQLPTPTVCQLGSVCDCAPDSLGNTSELTASNSPICQPPAGGPPGTTQYFAKAYPGTRELSFARALGNRAASASICPRNASATDSADYGYVPALNALVERVAMTLK